MDNPFPLLASHLYRFRVITEIPKANHDWLQALLEQKPETQSLQLIPEASPATDKPENGLPHTAAQKILHYTVNALLYNLENKLTKLTPNPSGNAQSTQPILTPAQEAGLYWLANQFIQKSITRTNHPIFTYLDNNGEIKFQKHYNQLNSTIKRLRGVITASALETESNQEILKARKAISFPPLDQLAKLEKTEWEDKKKTQTYNEIFLDLNPQAAAPLDPLNLDQPHERNTNNTDRAHPKEAEGFDTHQLRAYQNARKEQLTNPDLNNPEAWTLLEKDGNRPALNETKRYLLEHVKLLLDKAEQTPGIGFQLPQQRWASNRTYAYPHALRRMYEALNKAGENLSELDPSPETLQALQKEHFSFGIQTACTRTGISYEHFQAAWASQLLKTPNLINTHTRPEAILNVLKTLNQEPQQAIRFLEEFAVTGGYSIEISPRQRQYREQVSDILANIASEIQLERLHQKTATHTNPDKPEARAEALEPILRTPISGILRRELESNVRQLLKKELEERPALQEALQEIKRTSADLRAGTYSIKAKQTALSLLIDNLAQSPESIRTSPPVTVSPGSQFSRNLQYLSDHLPGFNHLLEQELSGAAKAYLDAKKRPEQDYCVRLAERGDPQLTRQTLSETNQAISFLEKTQPLKEALDDAKQALQKLITPAHQLSFEDRQANKEYFEGLARAATLWRNHNEHEQFQIPQKGYSTLRYARNLSANRLEDEFFRNKLTFSPQMQSDFLVLGLNILEKWKNNPESENNPKRHLPTLHKLKNKLIRTLEVDPTEAQEEAKKDFNLPEIILERTETALFNFLRAQTADIQTQILALPSGSKQPNQLQGVERNIRITQTAASKKLTPAI